MAVGPASLPVAGTFDRRATIPGVGTRHAGHVDWLYRTQVLLLLLLPWACYWPALRGEFLWDDGVLVLNNQMLGSLDGLRRIWFSTEPLDYFPLTLTSFWVEKWLWGDHPSGYHVVNLALHIASAFLLWRLLRLWRVPGAWLAALLFAVHPLNVASVAWISERKNVLSMVFYLASLISFVRWRRQVEASGAWRLYLATLGWFVLAVLSKSSVVMLPCVLLLVVWWQEGRVRWRDLAWAAPFFVVSLAAGLLTLWFQRHHVMSVESLTHTVPPMVRILTASRAIWFYLGKVLCPYPLSMLYPRWTVSVGDPWAYLAPAGLVAMLAGGWWARRFWGRAPLAAFGYFVLTILPVSGLLSMSFFTFSDASDHLVYLSVPAVLALVAAGLTCWHSAGGVSGSLALSAMTAAVGLACLGCVQRADNFRSVENLWRSTLEVNPRSFAAHNYLGLVYQERGSRDPRLLLVAESHYRAALEAEPDLEFAGLNLADVLRLEGRWAESAQLYRRVLVGYPSAETYNNYGVTLLQQGDNVGARQAFYNALRIKPRLGNAYHNLFFIEQAEHRLPQAFAALRACLRINPDDVTALDALVRLGLDQSGASPLPMPAAEVLTASAERACVLTQYHDAKSLALLSQTLRAAGRLGEADAVAAQASEVARASGAAEPLSPAAKN